MPHISDSVLNEFIAAASRIAGLNLLQCSSGNLSVRVDDEHFAVSGSRSWLGELRPEQIALCRLSDGESLNGVKPSVETTFHRGILAARPEVRVVLHFQSPAATVLACRGDCAALDFFVIPEIPYYIGRPAIVPYLPPGSPELAAAVTAAMGAHDLAILRNHGLVTVGESYAEATQRAVFFELACHVIVAGGVAVEPLSAAAAADLHTARNYGR